MAWFDNGLMSIFGAQNPEAFAQYAAQTGAEPPPLQSLQRIPAITPQPGLSSPGVPALPTGGLSPAAMAATGAGGGGSLADLLNPTPAKQSALAGLKAPETPQAQIPSPPGISASPQNLQVQDTLLKLLLQGQPAAAPVPSLAALIGR